MDRPIDAAWAAFITDPCDATLLPVLRLVEHGAEPAAWFDNVGRFTSVEMYRLAGDVRALSQWRSVQRAMAAKGRESGFAAEVRASIFAKVGPAEG